MLVGCAHPSAPGRVPEQPMEQLRRPLPGPQRQDMAQDRARTQRLTQALGKQLAIPWWRGSDTHQAVQYGCISTVFARGCHGLRAVGGDAGRPVHHRRWRTRPLPGARRLPAEAGPEGGPRPGGLCLLLTQEAS